MFRELNEKVLKQLIYNIEIAILHVKGKVVKIFRRKDVCNICVRHLSIMESSIMTVPAIGVMI